jgi:hypothetical protein
MNQVTTCSFFKLDTLSAKWWAFKQMQLGHYSLKNVEGLTFSKILGSGSKNGFSSIPNFGTYVLLCVWNSEKEAENFFDENTFLKTYKEKSTENFTVFSNAAESHGFWDKKQPFKKKAKLELDQPVLVLTRARIRFTKLISFWRKVGKVSHSLENYDGVLVSIGIGEWPLIQQATISIWQTQAEMMDYAYKNEAHKKVIKLTRKLNWYKEELFARFVPYKMAGRWNGEDVTDLLSKNQTS